MNISKQENEDYLLLTFYKPKKNNKSISTIKNQILKNIETDIEEIVKNVNSNGTIELILEIVPTTTP